MPKFSTFTLYIASYGSTKPIKNFVTEANAREKNVRLPNKQLMEAFKVAGSGVPPSRPPAHHLVVRCQHGNERSCMYKTVPNTSNDVLFGFTYFIQVTPEYFNPCNDAKLYFLIS